MPEPENRDPLPENTLSPEAAPLNRDGQPRETALEPADRWESYNLSILSIFFDHC